MKKLLVIILCLFSFFQAAPLEGQAGSGFGPAGSFFDDAFSALTRAFDETDFTPEDAYFLGRAVTANILAVYRPYNNPELTRYLNQICMAIAINSPNPILFNGYHVIILDSPEFNAFASPGGHILLTRGLVEACSSEDMLAAVIAHELAHVMLEHGLAAIRNMGISSEMTAAANRAAALAGQSQAAQRLMLFRDSVTTTMDTMMRNGYSQTQEFEADERAVTLLAAAGYNPEALLDLLRILQQVQGSQRGGFNTTHPSPAERIANIQGTVIRHRVQDTGSFRQSRFTGRTR